MSADLADLPVHRAAEMLRRREVSSVELTRAALARIEQRDRDIHAYLHVDAEGAIAAARVADEALARDGAGASPLCGIPYGLKDNISTAGMPTTCGSKILRG